MENAQKKKICVTIMLTFVYSIFTHFIKDEGVHRRKLSTVYIGLILNAQRIRYERNIFKHYLWI